MVTRHAQWRIPVRITKTSLRHRSLNGICARRYTKQVQVGFLTASVKMRWLVNFIGQPRDHCGFDFQAMRTCYFVQHSVLHILIPIVSTDINECDGAMCLNGATCEDGINSYSCLCQSGFTGNMCETGSRIKLGLGQLKLLWTVLGYTHTERRQKRKRHVAWMECIDL